MHGAGSFVQLLVTIGQVVLEKKQEAHGPHRSPEKTVQINKHI